MSVGIANIYIAKNAHGVSVFVKGVRYASGRVAYVLRAPQHGLRMHNACAKLTCCTDYTSFRSIAEWHEY